MKIAICGQSGLVGSKLTRFFEEGHNEVVGVRVRAQTDPEEIAQTIEGSDIVVNLAGATILARWSEEYKRTLRDSRIDTTRKLVDAVGLCREKPKLLLSASAVGIYDSHHQHDEKSAHLADDFLSRLCREWEAEALRAEAMGVRVCLTRFGVIYAKEGGAMRKMLPPFYFGLGGKVGSGEQMVSWIHLDDLVGAVDHIIRHPEIGGVVNFTAPYPLTNAEQTRVMGEVLNRPTFFTVPEFMLKLIFGEGSTVMLDSKEVYPKVLLDTGYRFEYPTLSSALDQIVS